MRSTDLKLMSVYTPYEEDFGAYMQINKMVKFEGVVESVHAMKAYRGSRSIAPPTLNFSARWRFVVNITSRPL
jgi:hypothetical protein